MAAGLEAARRLVELDPDEEALLTGRGGRSCSRPGAPGAPVARVGGARARATWG